MLTARKIGNSTFGLNTKFRFQRSSTLTPEAARKDAQRKREKAKEMAEAAKGCKPLTTNFVKIVPRSIVTSILYRPHPNFLIYLRLHLKVKPHLMKKKKEKWQRRNWS